ncbi:hypothetical protein E2986_09386 [Frieseomelitta varia]|uniref:Uncharacterized protein n=1 Tax=Frieseomelitta varia TaxID=561572 RepID=A0A833RLB6_9HYME|nr:protein slender lobes-like isoform X1 [Frieseomelitta varia]KAF3421028.1 hypothetical protein E2986_09386 [Frieseomelitta varia]
MSKNKKSTKKCSVQQENCKTNNVHEDSLSKNMKVDIGNDSPQHSSDLRISGYSTPIRKRDYVYDVEDSPELDYRCSPVSMFCTQDGGNEIAWDWQTSGNKNSCDKSKTPNSHVETPKRTKQLQKKRNSDSPLLQKPLKRKQVKMENIENIGKLTAELRALNEKMKTIQQNCNNKVENEDDTIFESSSKLVIELDSDGSEDIMVDCVVESNKLKLESSINNNNNKKPTSYEDLFDDSIDDSMVKCSQEIEKKLNLCKDKKNDTMELSNEKKELSPSKKEIQYLTISNTSTERPKSSKSCSTNTNGHLKTYSNNLNRTNVSVSSSRLTKCNVINVSHGKQTLQDKITSDFLDDSFDDCLATCVEDDKLLSKLSEYDFSPSKSYSNVNHSKKSLRLISDPIINRPNNSLSKLATPDEMFIIDDLVEEVEVITDKKTIQKSFPSQNSLENRKFFKTKCLSDQGFYQYKNSKTNTSKIGSNLVTSTVSTTSPKDQNPYKNNNIPSINGVGNTHELNRLDGKESGNGIVKHKSASNLPSIKESQSVRCTPEEIERKRLEAKMRLEAKRKLQQTNTKSTDIVSESSERKSIKR